MDKYFTIYGNVCEYDEGDDTAYDVDMAEEIPVEMVDFSTKGLTNDPLEDTAIKSEEDGYEEERNNPEMYKRGN